MTNDQQLVPSDVMGRFFREMVRHHLDEAGHTASVYPAWEEISDKLKAASTAAMKDLHDLLLAHFDRAAGAAIAEARTQAFRRARMTELTADLPEPPRDNTPTLTELVTAWPVGTPIWYRRYGNGPWEQSVTKTVPWRTSGIGWVTVESVPAQAGAALKITDLRTLDNPPPDTELEPPTTPL